MTILPPCFSTSRKKLPQASLCLPAPQKRSGSNVTPLSQPKNWHREPIFYRLLLKTACQSYRSRDFLHRRRLRPVRRAALSGDFHQCRFHCIRNNYQCCFGQKQLCPQWAPERARPAAGRKDLLSPSAVFRDRFLPFRKRACADAAHAISERAIRNP